MDYYKIFGKSFRFIVYICLLICTLTIKANGQTVLTWNDFVDMHVNSETYDSEEWSYIEELHDHPLNINQATRAELLSLPFLEVHQVDSLLSYRERYGAIKNLGELLFVKNIDYSTRAFLHLFLYCDTVNRSGKNKVFIDGDSKFIVEMGLPFYKRDGYRSKPLEYVDAHPNSVYAGPGIDMKIQYQYNYNQILKWGIGGDRDAGEPIMKQGNFPFDSYSFYVVYQPERTSFRMMVGDYKLKAGEGLLLSNTFILDNGQLFVNDRGQSADFIVKKSVSTPFNSFRGLVMSYEFRNHLKSMAWISYTGRDANLKDGNITSFKTDNLHRTNLELSKKNNVHEIFTGLNIEYSKYNFVVGSIFSYTRFSRRILPREAKYTQFYFRGKELFNGSLYSTINVGFVALHGEVAVDDDFNVATTVFASSNFRRRISLYAGYRYFSPSFHSMHGKTLAVNNRIANEEGGIMGMKIGCNENSYFYLNANLFRFKHPLYRTSIPSYGFIGDMKYESLIRKKMTLGIGYQYKIRQYDEAEFVCYNYYNRFKVYLKNVFGKWNLTSQICYNNNWSALRKLNMGCCISERFVWKTIKHTVSFLGSIFYSDSYETRNYVSGLSFPFSYRTISLYGKGAYLSVKYVLKAGKHYDIGAISRHVFYFDRSSIGTGLQRIPSFCKNDLSVQLQINL